MRNVLWCATLALMLFGTANVQAEILIDDYNTAGNTGATGSTAMRSVPSVTNAVVSFGVGGANAEHLAGSGADDVTVQYTWGSGSEPNLGYERWLTLDVVSAIGDWAVTMTYSGLGGTGPAATLTGAITNGTVGPVLFDLATGGNSGHLNGVQNLTLNFVNTADGPLSQRALTLGNLSATPEPASLALLGMTGIGGVIAVRRRRKSVKTA